MSSITILGTAPALAAVGAKGSAADNAQAPAIDFSTLLGAGMDAVGLDPTLLPATVPPVELTGDALACAEEATKEDGLADPAVILDAIAAARGPENSPPATAAQAPIVPALGLPPGSTALTKALPADAGAGTQGNPTRTAKSPAKGTELASVQAERPAVRADNDGTRFDPALAAAKQAVALPERGAAGELRAEILSRAIPESQSATHLLHAQQPAHAPSMAAAQRMDALPQAIATPAWNDGLANQVVWMARNDVQTAELRLNPADLGPIEITLTLTGDDKSQATVQFSAAHATTREAIETALPRLREMLQESGITLGQAGVDANNSRATDGGERRGPGGESPGRPGGPSEPAATPLPRGIAVTTQGRGLVDTFA